MKQHKFAFRPLGILIASAACLAAGAAYGEDGAPASHDADNGMAPGVSRTVTLTNSSNMTLREVEVELKGKDRNDFAQTNNCGEELKGKASCSISVTFQPRSPGPKSATVQVHTSGGSQVVYLSGTGR